MPRRKEPQPFDLVEVAWEDAKTEAGTQYNTVQEALDAYKPCMRKSVGLYVGYTEGGEALLIATDDDRCDELPDAVGGISQIPAGMVRKVRRVGRT